MPELEVKDQRRNEFVGRFREFLRKKYYQELVKASHDGKPLSVDFQDLELHSPEMSDLLLQNPEYLLEITEEAIQGIELPSPVRARFFNLPETSIVPIRDLRARHIGKLISTEGIVRKASEIRPEIIGVVWECPECDSEIETASRGNFIPKPYSCDCGNKMGFRQKEKKRS